MYGDAVRIVGGIDEGVGVEELVVHSHWNRDTPFERGSEELKLSVDTPFLVVLDRTFLLDWYPALRLGEVVGEAENWDHHSAEAGTEIAYLVYGRELKQE